LEIAVGAALTDATSAVDELLALVNDGMRTR
jgi:hypothetical protein